MWTVRGSLSQPFTLREYLVLMALASQGSYGAGKCIPASADLFHSLSRQTLEGMAEKASTAVLVADRDLGHDPDHSITSGRCVDFSCLT